MTDSFETLESEARTSIKVRRSEFIGIAFPVGNEDQFRARLDEIRRELHSARHHCWAFRTGAGSSGIARSSDDGEPAGSAGRPIAAAIESSGLEDVACVVARWFGGVKLGTGGLGRAYREAAAGALAGGPRRTVIEYRRLSVEVPFESLSEIYRLVDSPNVVLAGEHFSGEGNRFELDVRLGRLGELERSLDELRLTWRETGDSG